jgi:CheY-like chemotaxis protein
VIEEGSLRIPLLLVDDEPKNHLALEALLTAPDRDLVHAHSGAEALRHLLDRRFAAVVLDVQMPDMDGLETATLIRAREQSRDTPILFLTAGGDTHRERSYALGAVDYLTKPVEPEVLQAKIAVFVDLFRKSALIEAQAAELARQARLEGALLAIRTVEHELGNSLAGVQGYLQLLRSDKGLSEQARNRLDSALSATTRASSIVQQLRTLTEVPERDWGLRQGSTIHLGDGARLAAPANLRHR